jgi:hypothetical protein
LVAPMNIGRQGHAAVECAGCIYVVGGFVRDDPDNASTMEPTSTMERYDPQSGAWTRVASFSRPVSERPAVCCRGCVYVGDSEGWNVMIHVSTLGSPYVSWQEIATLSHRMLPVVEIPFSLFVLKSISRVR